MALGSRLLPRRWHTFCPTDARCWNWRRQFRVNIRLTCTEGLPHSEPRKSELLYKRISILIVSYMTCNESIGRIRFRFWILQLNNYNVALHPVCLGKCIRRYHSVWSPLRDQTKGIIHVRPPPSETPKTDPLPNQQKPLIPPKNSKFSRLRRILDPPSDSYLRSPETKGAHTLWYFLIPTK